jgi:hypothetical protein
MTEWRIETSNERPHPMPRRPRVVKQGRIEIYNFNASAVTRFNLNPDIGIRLGNMSDQQAAHLGTTFEPSGVLVTIAEYDDGSLRIAREQVHGDRPLTATLRGVFSIFKRGDHSVEVLTAVRQQDWDTFLRSA